MPWIATLDSAVKPRTTTRLAIENHRNHPRIATAASTIATLMPMPHTAVDAGCIQSEEVGSSHRDVIEKKEWMSRPKACAAIRATPAQRRLLFFASAPPAEPRARRRSATDHGQHRTADDAAEVEAISDGLPYPNTGHFGS